MGSSILKKSIPHLIAVITFLVLNMIYFYPQLQGKKVAASDVVGNKGMVKETVEFHEKTGEYTLWTNSMFGGMPTYQIGGYGVTTLFDSFRHLIKLGFSDPIGVFFLANISFYILFLVCGLNPWLSIIGAVAFGFMTNNFVLWDTGHTNKLNVIATSGLVIAGVLATYWKEKHLMGFVLFGVGLGLNIYYNHPQMTYYLFLAMLIYVVGAGIQSFKKGQLAAFGKGTAVLAVAGILAVGSSAATLGATYEYSKDTMRGDPILKSVANTEAQTSSETAGLAYNYAMQWSAGFLDLVNVIIPRSVGGSSSEKVGANSTTYKDLTSKGARLPKDFAAPMYWGSMGSTSGTYYVGAIIFMLFFLGAQLIKGPVKWWLTGSVLLTFMLALGKNFALLNEPLFNHLPLLSKFRAPSSILGVSAIFFVVLALLGLGEFIKERKDKKSLLKPLYIAAGISGGICLFFGLLGGSLFDFTGQSDPRLQQAGYDLNAIISDRKSLLRNDALRSLLFIALAAGLMWAYVTEKIKTGILLAGIGVLITIDLWTVGQRYLSASEFAKPRQMDQLFQPRPVDQQIMNVEKSRGDYRVFDMSIDVFNSSSTSYFHNTIGGYHPAKLQRYQDLIDYHISKGTQSVMDMLNAKYYISQQGQLQNNPGALGPVWFVESVQKVATPNDEINALGAFDPANQAVVLDVEFGNYIGSFDPEKGGAISLISYQPNHLTYASNSTSEQLAVFSEIWYGPDKGWQAYIDGAPVEHIRANYALRAMKIPAGEHTIEFKFDPSSFKTGQTVSLASSGLILLALLAYIGYSFMQMKEKSGQEVPVRAPKEMPRKSLPKTQSRSRKRKKK